jgi:hypothetical protein
VAAVEQAVEKAKSQLTVRRFNLDGFTLDTGPKLKTSGSDNMPPE